MRSHVISAAMMTFAVALTPSPASGGHVVKCSETTLLDASGYPGTKTKYSVRGLCKVSFKSGKRTYVKDYIAKGNLTWEGATGKTTEALLINGQTMQTVISCVLDPFVGKATCSGAKFIGDLEIKKAVEDSQRPIFAEAVNPTMAEMFSKKKGAGPPPPPPPAAPKITLDIAVSRLNVHAGTHATAPPQGRGILVGSAGLEYWLVCSVKANNYQPKGTRLVFKANGVVLSDKPHPVSNLSPIYSAAKWKPTSLGTYSLTCEANPDRKPAETNYANNKSTMSFPVDKFAVQLGAIPSVSPPPRVFLSAIPTPTSPARRRG